MPIPWTAKRQITIFLIVTAVIVAAIALVIIATSKSTCFDNKQNGSEQGIDCGGSCEPCLGEVKDLIVVWSKALKLGNGKYDAAALIKNPNLFAGLPLLKYKFKFYDANNILIAIRAGETFINPGDRYVVFETDIDTGRRVPKSAFLELEENPRWKRIEKKKPQIIISGKTFTNRPFPRLVAEIGNESLFQVNGVSLAAVLFSGEGNAIAVSATAIDSIAGSASRQVVFTWPAPFTEEPALSKIFLRTNLTK